MRRSRRCTRWRNVSGFDARLAQSGEIFVLESAAGDLHLRCEAVDAERLRPRGGCACRPRACATRRAIRAKTHATALGIELGDLDSSVPLTRTRDNDVIAVVRRYETLNNIRPDLGLLNAWQERNKVRGVLVSTLNTLSESVHVQSRFFAPASGVPEDPVTGSVHGPLGTLLVVQEMVPLVDNSAALICLQGIPGGRMGMVHIAVKASSSGYDVAIAGSCVTTMRGELNVPGQE
jgi:trans-2,3-dihydro-3-hydroxyanthranilate isomerase